MPHLCHSTINFAVMDNAAFLQRCGRLRSSAERGGHEAARRFWVVARSRCNTPPEERRAIAQQLFDRASGLMGKSRPHPQIIEAEAIEASK
jgi:hypothetical protein